MLGQLINHLLSSASARPELMPSIERYLQDPLGTLRLYRDQLTALIDQLERKPEFIDAFRKAVNNAMANLPAGGGPHGKEKSQETPAQAAKINP